DLDALLALAGILALEDDGADLAGAAQMRAAAGDAREAGDLPISASLGAVAEGADDGGVAGDDRGEARGEGGEERGQRLRPEEIDPRLLRRDMGADLGDARQHLVGELEHDLGGEMETHQPVAPDPVDRNFDRLARRETMTLGQAIADLGA